MEKIIYILYENIEKLHRNLTLYNNPICYRNLIKAIIKIILIVINGFLSIKKSPPLWEARRFWNIATSNYY